MMRDSWISDAAESYDRVAERYVDVACEGLTNLPLESSLVAYFAGQVNATGEGRVIDLGCGPGLLTRHLASLGLSVTGMDISRAMLRMARKNNPGHEFIEASLTRLPFIDGAAAGVFCWYVMHHVPDDDLRPAFREVARVLQPGGHLMLGGHVGDRSYVKTEGYGGLSMNVLFARRSPDAYAELIREAGLIVDATIARGPDQPPGEAVWLAHKPD